MPDMAWLMDGGCIAAAHTTVNGAAIFDVFSSTEQALGGKRGASDRGTEVSAVWPKQTGIYKTVNRSL